MALPCMAEQTLAIQLYQVKVNEQGVFPAAVSTYGYCNDQNTNWFYQLVIATEIVTTV